MTQIDIMEMFSKDKKKWFTIEEIANKLDIGKQSVTACLRRLRRSGFVKFDIRRNHPNPPKYVYGYK